MTISVEKLAAIRADLAKKRSLESDSSLDDIATVHEVSKILEGKECGYNNSESGNEKLFQRLSYKKWLKLLVRRS